MKINSLNFLIVGFPGEGVDRPGALFSRLCMEEGLNVHSTAEFYSLIKSQEHASSYQIRVSEKQLYSHLNRYDLMLALCKNAKEHLEDMVPGGGVIYDPDIMGEELQKEGVFMFPIPLKKIAQEQAGLALAKNIVGLGAAIALLDYSLEDFLKLIEKSFAKKGAQIIEKNINAAKAGHAYIKEHFNHPFSYQLKPVEAAPRMMMDGNEAISLGAIKAGCKFVAEYPMTPSSSVLHTMARHAREAEISVNHVEDEISAVNMVVGAGYAGVRAMAATSGGGFSLMSEAIGLAGMLEVPAVIVECQRPGPSTGLPTRTGQGDLRQVMHASQGEFPRIVMSPGTHEEAFYMAFEAFNLAERFQTAVILLGEKYLCEGRSSMPVFKHDHLKIDRGKLLDEKDIPEGFERFKWSEDGVSDRTIPGQKGGSHTASSYEHREDGNWIEDAEAVTKMQARRMKKMETIEKSLPPVTLEGKENAEVTLVCWGATYGPAREALDWLEEKGVIANLMHIKYLLPLQPGVRKTLEKAKHPILVEGNLTAQLGGVIAEKAGMDIQDKILDWSGRPFTPDMIANRVMEMLNK